MAGEAVTKSEIYKQYIAYEERPDHWPAWEVKDNIITIMPGERFCRFKAPGLKGKFCARKDKQLTISNLRIYVNGKHKNDGNFTLNVIKPGTLKGWENDNYKAIYAWILAGGCETDDNAETDEESVQSLIIPTRAITLPMLPLNVNNKIDKTKICRKYSWNSKKSYNQYKTGGIPCMTDPNICLRLAKYDCSQLLLLEVPKANKGKKTGKAAKKTVKSKEGVSVGKSGDNSEHNGNEIEHGSKGVEHGGKGVEHGSNGNEYSGNGMEQSGDGNEYGGSGTDGAGAK